MAVVEGAAVGTNRERYVVQIRSGKHELVADEPPANGGTDEGAGPFSLLAAGLVACTAITLRMYAERKSWPLADVRVDAKIVADEESGERVERVVVLDGDLDDEQRARLLEIAEKTPVTKTLKRSMPITTTLG